jgi:two-component system NtrC family sensor kinase
MAEMIKSGLVSTMLQGRGPEYRHLIGSLMTEDMKAVRLYRADGKLVSAIGPGGDEQISDEQKALSNIPLSPKLVYNGQGIPAQTFMPLYNSQSCQGCHGTEKEVLGILSVELSSAYAEGRIHKLRMNFFLFYAISFLVIFLPLLYLLHRFVTRPLKAISHAVKAVSRGNLNVRLPERGSDEIAALSRDLNATIESMESMKKQVEASHQQTLKKMEKMASLGELAAAVAHEIKNPLAGISGAIQVLAEDIPSGDPRKEIIREILSEIDRLDQSIKNLLTFARPADLRFVPTHILPVIERSIRIIAKQAEKQGVAIRIDEAREGKPVHLDPEQMEQVFLNLMINALHSMPSGGTLSISVLARDAEHAEAVFSDTGTGIEPEALANIFKPFFTTKHAGTGLGLAISKNIVEKHGGIMEAESRPGLGSIFHVIIPYLTESKNGQS